MTAATAPATADWGASLRGSVKSAWDHPYVGPALRVVLAYVVLVEIGVQFVFGRVQLGPISMGLFSSPVPRAIFLNGAAIGMLYALLGMGLILVYRANHIINFAQAQLGSVPAVLGLQLMLRKDVNYFLVIPLVVGTAVALGWVVEVTVMRRFRDAPRLIATVATIGVALLLLFVEFQVQTWITGNQITSSSFVTPFSRFEVSMGALSFDGNFAVAAIATVGISLALTGFFKYTDMGVAVRASAENRERASLLGIPVAKVSTVVWIIAAVLSAVAVFLRAPLVGLTVGSSVGPSVLLYGLAAAVIARMDKLGLCIAAGIGIGIIDQSALFGTARASLAQAAVLPIILVALLVQRGTLSRAFDAGVATWQAAKEYRPIPLELRDRSEVVLARGALANVVLFVAVLLPLLLPDRFAGRFAQVVIIAMIGVSLVILAGWSGQISLGQFAFAGIGSFVAGGLAIRGWDFFVVLLVAGLAGALAAVLIGLPALRIPGLFLAVTTLAFAFTVEKLVLNRTYVDSWIPSVEPIERPKLYGFFSTTSDIRFYFVCLAFLVLSLVVARSIRVHRVGRILIGVRDNHRGVQAYGVNLARTRLAAFAISGFIAAVAGALLAYQLKSVDGATFSPDRSVAIFTIAVIGGLTSLPGAILGAIFVEGIPFLFDGDQTVRLLTSSVGLLFLLLVVPGGLSEVAYRGRDAFLRWVAARNHLHVPSLVADSLVTREVEPDDPAPESDDPAQRRRPQSRDTSQLMDTDTSLIGCPQCGARIPVDEAHLHAHFAVDQEPELVP